MIKGDILLVYEDDILKEYLVYDRHLAIRFNLTGVVLYNVDDLTQHEHKVVTVKHELTWAKKQKLNEYLLRLITGKLKPTFKQRIHILKYITWIYANVVKVDIIEPALPINEASLLKSDNLIIY